MRRFRRSTPGGGCRGGKRVFPENFLMRNTGAAGRRSAEREIQRAQRAPAAGPAVRHGENGGSFLCACDAGGRLHAPSRRIHDGSGAGPGPGPRSSPFRMQDLQGFAGRRSPGREIPHAPQTRSPRLPKHGKRSGRGRPAIRWKAREADATTRMRSSAALGAYAHAGHASRTLFANATADIFLRSLSNAAIFLRRICYCRYST